MAIIPQTDEELAAQRLQTEGRPTMDAARRNQALTAMAPSGALTSGARSTVSGQIAGQTANTMTDLSNKIGTGIFSTRQGEAEAERARLLQSGEALNASNRASAESLLNRNFQGGQVTDARAEAERLRRSALGMAGYGFDANGNQSYRGKVADPNTGEMLDATTYATKYGAVTEADIARTNQANETLQNRGFTAYDPEVKATQEGKMKDYYKKNPSQFLVDNDIGLNESYNKMVATALASGDTEAAKKAINDYTSRTHQQTRDFFGNYQGQSWTDVANDRYNTLISNWNNPKAPATKV